MESAHIFSTYQPPQSDFDEFFSPEGGVRPHNARLFEFFSHLSKEKLDALHGIARDVFFNQGITFNVYSDNPEGVEKIFPFDLAPRVIAQSEWQHLEAGLMQRNRAINLFIEDLYHDKKILKAGVVPHELVFSCPFFQKSMIGFRPVGGIYVHVAGTDLIKHNDGAYYVLEDNLRCPSGVSYVLSNRMAMKRLLPALFLEHEVMAVQDYPEELATIMHSVAPPGVENPTCVVLSPGMFNSAYYEHAFLALSMGIELVEGRDLFVEKNEVFMKTVRGPKRVDLIYRRIDDDFLDPMVFRPDSMLGVPGIMAAYRAGKVNILNAPGTGAADDKAIYAYIPDVIRYYLGEEPILQNVPTYRCGEPEEMKFVLEHMHELVVKPVDESGGYGVIIGSHCSKAELAACRERVLANPRKYIAQPIMRLSMHPTFIDETHQFEPRHIDLRTFTLTGKDCGHVLKGGLSRVALRRGSLIVNSSQGGGSKDTWVLSR